MDYSYLLYFERKSLWEALNGVVGIAEPYQPPATITFPDRVLSISLDTWGPKGNKFQHDNPEFAFALTLNFEPDKVILDYLDSRFRGDDHRDPSSKDANRVAIGTIYLTVYQDIPHQPKSELVLFDFGTTGTSMSLLFDNSPSIRKTFLGLLKKHKGVCGVFNRETSGELFWLKGNELSEWFDDPRMMPAEIEAILGMPKKRRNEQ